MISTELQDFYKRWRRKAHAYRAGTLQGCFDRFFTLYVAYNRLYAEVSLSQARKHQHQLGRRDYYYTSDSYGAKDAVREYLGTDFLWNSFQNDPQCRNAIDAISTLIADEVFAIKLNRLYGTPQREKDLQLVNHLRHGNRFQRVQAVLDVIYSIRCNMFHGHKGFNQVQIQMLEPVTVLLEKVSGLLYGKME